MTAPHPAVEAARAGALALLGPDQHLGLYTDADTFAKGKKPAVLVAIARPGYSVVLAIDSSEYSGLDVAFMAGFEPAERESAHEKAQRKLTTKS